MATYIVTPVDGDTAGRGPGARRFKTRSAADAFFTKERDAGRPAIMYKEDYDHSGEVDRANWPKQDATMELPDFLSRDAEGDIRLTGHRIGLIHLVQYYNDGYSPEMLMCQYPTLSLALIHKVIAFYLENRTEVDRYVATCNDELSRQRGTNPKRLDVTTLRQRLDSMQHARRP